MGNLVENNRLKMSLVPDGKFVVFPAQSVKTIKTSEYTYIGLTGVGLSEHTDKAIWRLFRIKETDTEDLVQWADGNDHYDNVLDDYATKNYK